MRETGRVNLIALFGIVVVVMVAIVLIFSKQGPGAAGSQFMDALTMGDVDRLTALSDLGDTPKEEIHKEWEFATQVAAKHYSFSWSITSSNATGDTGSVQLSVYRNVASPGSYAENFQLPMRLEDGQWKVDVRNVSSEMYPAIPRGS
jgi:hypothetical protein